MWRDGNLELQRRRRGDLDFEVRAHFSLHHAEGTERGSATKTARRAALAIGGPRLTFSGCPALVVPRRVCRSHFPALRPALGTRTKYVLNSHLDAGTRCCRPAHVGMVADNTRFGDMRHVCLAICPPERAAG